MSYYWETKEWNERQKSMSYKTDIIKKRIKMEAEKDKKSSIIVPEEIDENFELDHYRNKNI